MVAIQWYIFGAHGARWIVIGLPVPLVLMWMFGLGCCCAMPEETRAATWARITLGLFTTLATMSCATGLLGYNELRFIGEFTSWEAIGVTFFALSVCVFVSWLLFLRAVLEYLNDPSNARVALLLGFFLSCWAGAWLATSLFQVPLGDSHFEYLWSGFLLTSSVLVVFIGYAIQLALLATAHETLAQALERKVHGSTSSEPTDIK
jgi:hypothetical protein